MRLLRQSQLFTPASLFAGGVVGAWYDPSDLSTLFQDTAGTTPVTADGQSVARINDKSGNAKHLTQATAGFRPLYKTAGGLSWLDFDGVDDFLSGGDVLDLGTNSYFCSVAAKFDTAADGGLINKALYAGLDGRYSITRGTVDFGGLSTAYYPVGGSVIAAVADNSTLDRVITAQLDRTAGSLKLFANKVQQGATQNYAHDETVNQNTIVRFLMGAFNDATDAGIKFPLDGRIYGVVLKEAVSYSQAEIAKAESWLGIKAGLAI